jgi:transcription antitermination factor NusB
MKKRSLARELALQCLCPLDVQGDDAMQDVEEILAEGTSDSAVKTFARELARGCHEHRADIDRELTDVAEHWNLRRMAVVDRNILRLGAFELIHRPDTPPTVAINEAIELAKRYSTAESGAFVNGILDKVRLRLAAAKVPRPRDDD